ncbi:hypothetical protein FB451DRAFT_1565737 [Mycena latifolia]|nr:hypothetical protein FB451DRAFT_1565737 [Mycena latifolia]
MEETRPRRSKKAKTTGIDRNCICSVCGGEQRNQAERFRICSGCKEKLGIKRYFCSRACQKADWKTHRDFCGSQDFWDYTHKPLLGAEASFERPVALRCQIALIDSNPDVLYHVAPGTDDVLRFDISDKMLKVSFCRVRDKAFTTHDPESIAILGQTLLGAVELEAVPVGKTQRVSNLFRQLEEEYGVLDIESVVASLQDDQTLDPTHRTKLDCLHQENITRHPSDFWKALAKPIDD